MDLGRVTLLEIDQTGVGKRLAYCLASGEFVFVARDVTSVCRVSAATDLFGKNLCDFLVPYDVEKLQDYMRAHSHNGVVSSDNSNQLAMIARVDPSGLSVRVRLRTIPITLRLMRCIDAVTVLAPLRHFADASSFVLSEEDIASVANEQYCALVNQSRRTDCASGSSVISTVGNQNAQHAIPLELKRLPSYDALASTSPISPSGLLDSIDDSLANYAFEADWATETYPNGPSDQDCRDGFLIS